MKPTLSFQHSKMKVVLLITCLVSAAFSAPAVSDADLVRYLPAVLHEEVHDEFGQYALRYVTAENTVVSERGRLVPTENGVVLEVEGQYQFLGTDGKVYVTKYKGGRDGFHVEGEHIPTSAPVPKK